MEGRSVAPISSRDTWQLAVIADPATMARFLLLLPTKMEFEPEITLLWIVHNGRE